MLYRIYIKDKGQGYELVGKCNKKKMEKMVEDFKYIGKFVLVVEENKENGERVVEMCSEFDDNISYTRVRK